MRTFFRLSVIWLVVAAWGVSTPKADAAVHGQQDGFTTGAAAQANSSGVSNASQSSARDVRNNPPASRGPLTGPPRAVRRGLADKKRADVFLVDRNLPESTLLGRAVPPGGRVFFYDSAHEPAAEVLSRVVTWAEAARVELASLSVLSHGAPGAFELGDQWITTSSAGLTAEVWRGLSGVLAPGARINLFGCDIAAPGGDGQQLLDDLARLTGADVFASDDVTGRGGDWELEASSSGASHGLAASGPPPLNVALLESSNVSLAWYSPSWLYRKQITIDHTKVSGGVDLTDFPFLVNLGADADLAANAQANGNDILFTSADGTTKLSHEIETYTSATGALIAWVNVPSLSVTVDTVLYIYYGNPGASNQQNPTAVWDADYQGVWHLKENGALARDSTSHANNATSGTLPTQTAGAIGFGQAFDGSTQTVGIPDTASLQIATDGTFSVWFKVNDLRQSDLFEKGGNGGYTTWQDATNLWWGPQNGTVAQWSTAAGVLATGQWYLLEGVSEAGIQKLYLNGTLAAQSTRSSQLLQQRHLAAWQRRGWTLEWQSGRVPYFGRRPVRRVDSDRLQQPEFAWHVLGHRGPTGGHHARQWYGSGQREPGPGRGRDHG